MEIAVEAEGLVAVADDLTHERPRGDRLGMLLGDLPRALGPEVRLIAAEHTLQNLVAAACSDSRRLGQLRLQRPRTSMDTARNNSGCLKPSRAAP